MVRCLDPGSLIWVIPAYTDFLRENHYYRLSLNVSHFGKLQWVVSQSLAKTLAAKHKTTCRKLIRRYQSTVDTEHGETGLPTGRGGAGQCETPTGGTVRWHTPEAEPAGSSRRPAASAVQDGTQRAYQTAPSGHM